MENNSKDSPKDNPSSGLNLDEYSAKRIPWKLVKKAKRIVIKIGTRALIQKDRTFDEAFFAHLADDIEPMMNEGKEIILVSSGAVNAGVNALGLSERPRELVAQQVMAAIGNPLLMTQYQKSFRFCKIGQVLVTQEDFSSRISYNNLRNTLLEMIKRRVIPVINENDVVSVNELQTDDDTEYNFTDNDILSALVAASMDADLLIIFSDVDGLYTKHPNSPNAQFLAYIPKITDDILSMGKKGSKLGRGGMESKLIAVDIVTKANGLVIISDAKKSRLKEIFQGTAKLSFFQPNSEQLRNKDIWMIFGANLKGKVHVDKGAYDAVIGGASLLFQGITDFTGTFNKGEIVSLIHEEKYEPQDGKIQVIETIFGRGRINFSHEELELFKKMDVNQRKAFFKQNNIREIISHENMVFTQY